MKGVIDPIRVRTYGIDEWELLEDFEWNGIVVKAGFITDFASIPRFARGYINPVGRIRPAALVHDWLYNCRGVLPDQKISRKGCDKIFLQIMEYVDVPWTKRRLAYRAVRTFGWAFWMKKKNKKKKS